jgi:hypothetical protein
MDLHPVALIATTRCHSPGSVNWRSMKPRHAVALALVGWYLMIPPLSSEGKVDTHAPMSRWHQFMSFDAASACQKVLSELNSGEATEPNSSKPTHLH